MYVAAVGCALLLFGRSGAQALVVGLAGSDRGARGVWACDLALSPASGASRRRPIARLSARSATGTPSGSSRPWECFSRSDSPHAAGDSYPRATAAPRHAILLVTLYFTFSRGGWLCARRRANSPHLRSTNGRLRARLWSSSRGLASLSSPPRWLSRSPMRTPLGWRPNGMGTAWPVILIGLTALAAVAMVLLDTVELTCVRSTEPVSRLCGTPDTGNRRRSRRRVREVRIATDSCAAGVSRVQLVPVGDKNLNQRLFSLSSNGRARNGTQPGVTSVDPWLGSVAGGLPSGGTQHREARISVQKDVHNLYLETLAELGRLGCAAPARRSFPCHSLQR